MTTLKNGIIMGFETRNSYHSIVERHYRAKFGGDSFNGIETFVKQTYKHTHVFSIIIIGT